MSDVSKKVSLGTCFSSHLYGLAHMPAVDLLPVTRLHSTSYSMAGTLPLWLR